MGNAEDAKKSKQFERVYTAVLLLLVGLLLLVSILYTTHLWLAKVAIAAVLIGVSVLFGHKYLRER